MPRSGPHQGGGPGTTAAAAADWPWAPALPALAPGHVHLWWAGLPVEPSVHARLGLVLSDEERRRARRLRSPAHADAFVASRGVLRGILAAYLGMDPAAVPLAVGRHGKPHLDGAGDLRFSLSHSGGGALYAVARGAEVGVDLERVRPLDHARLAARFFTPAENDQLRSLPEAERLEGFFAGWTRKEALLKALGAGLSQGLDRFEVSLAPAVGTGLLPVRDRRRDRGGWSLLAVEAGPGFSAALAVEGAVAGLSRWRWRPP